MPDRRRAWAHALFNTSPNLETCVDYGSALEGISNMLASKRTFSLFFSDPSIKKADKVDLLSSVINSKDKIFRRFCEMIIEKKRVTLIPEISRVYNTFLEERQNSTSLTIEAASEPDAATIERLKSAWLTWTKKKATKIKVTIKPELIAGYRLRSGSLLIDYSVTGRLERLRRELSAPLNVSHGPPHGDTNTKQGLGNGTTTR